MKILPVNVGLCSILLVTALGCHSSSTTTVTQPVQTAAAPAPAPAPVAAAPAAPKPLVCTGLSADESKASDVEQGSEYGFLIGELGSWTSCVSKKLNKTDSQTVVTFVGGATLTVSEYPSSDAAETQAVLPAGTSVTREEVIKLLKQDEPQGGCGVVWSQLSAGGPNATGDFKGSGTSCTLEVHVKMEKGSVVGFGFGVAA